MNEGATLSRKSVIAADKLSAAIPTADISDEAIALKALLLSRTYLYTLFHKLLGAAPNAKVINALLSETTTDIVSEYAEENQTMLGLKRFLDKLETDENREKLLDEAKDEYTRLFIGPAALPALPWESPYRTNEATIFQENTLVVREIYRAHNLKPKQCRRVPDDHVALLCDFMAKQARVSLMALRSGDLKSLAHSLRDQQVFAAEHLANWLADYAQRARTSPTAVLYPQLIEALSAFADTDITFLKEAAFWAESHCGNDSLLGEYGAVETSSEEAAFETIERALKALEELNLFGIEENELAAIAQE